MASWAFETGFHRLDLEHAMGNTASHLLGGQVTLDGPAW
jgi:hypothetical protein